MKTVRNITGIRQRTQVARARAVEAAEQNNRGYLYEALAILTLSATDFFPTTAASLTGDINTPDYDMVQVKAHDGRFPDLTVDSMDVAEQFDYAMLTDCSDHFMVWSDVHTYWLMTKDEFASYTARFIGEHHNTVRLVKGLNKQVGLRLNYGKEVTGFHRKNKQTFHSDAYAKVAKIYEKTLRRIAREKKARLKAEAEA